MAMTIEQVRTAIALKIERERDAGQASLREWLEAIDAHLTQPAQAVDVGVIREVIAQLVDPADYERECILADKLTRAIGTAHGWIPIEQFQCPEYEGDCPGYIYLYREGMEPDGGYRMQIGNGMWLANRGKEHGVTHCMPLPTPPTDGEG